MKGVVYLGDRRVEVREFPRPEPGPGQVLIKMRVGGLCGSDLHKYRSDREWARGREGMISGHEPAGVVDAVGPRVEYPAVGDRVCVYHRLGCGHCPDCRSGYDGLCVEGSGAFGRTQDGSHADYMLAPARHCLPLPDGVSFETGTQLACTAGTSFAALDKIPAAPGEALVVFGLGPVGLAGLLWAVGKGYRGIGVDVQPYRLELAKKIGQGLVIDAGADDPVKAVWDLTDGRGAAGVLECSGNPRARTQAAAAAGRRATVVYVGGGSAELNLDVGALIGKDLRLRGNSVFSMAAYFEALEFLRHTPVPLDQTVTHRFGIEEAVEAFATFDAGETGKVALVWDD